MDFLNAYTFGFCEKRGFTKGRAWKESLRLYLGDPDEERFKEVEEKAQLIGYTRIMRRRIRRNGFDTEAGRAEIENAKAHILDILDRVDTLEF